MKNHISLTHNHLLNRIFTHTILATLLLTMHAQSFGAAAPAENHYRLTPLAVAIIQGHTAVARNIIEQDPTAITQKDCHGWTLLHFAAQHGHQHIAQYLIEKDPTLLTQKDAEGWTPLHIATACEHLNIVQCIVEKNPATLNLQTNKGSLPAFIAMIRKYHEITRYMTTMNAKHMPLHDAVKKGRFDDVRHMIEKDPAATAQTDFSSFTPLHIAVIEKHPNIVRLILEKCPDLITQISSNEFTPLHLAALYGNLEIAQYLIEKNPTAINQTDNGGWTPLHVAAREGHCAIAQQMLAKNPHSCNLKDDRGQSPLHLAAGGGHLDIVEAVLQADDSIDFRAKTLNNINILHIIPADKKMELTNLIKNHLLRLDQVDPKGKHIECPVCLENATACPECQYIADPLDRMRLTPCCLKVLCEHDCRNHLNSGNIKCPLCRCKWDVSIQDTE